jgi:uncharacterized protein YbjT (DUF2867 family)
MVDARDIAAVAAAALTGEGHEGKRYVVTGPEALTFAPAYGETPSPERTPADL